MADYRLEGVRIANLEDRYFDHIVGCLRDAHERADNGWVKVTDDLVYRAMYLLKEQQARIEKMESHEAKLLTFDEVKKHYSIPDELAGNLMESIDYSFDIAPLYMECPDEDQWVVHWRDYRSIEPFLEGWRKDYGKTWRCWTTKPTAEQRSAAKWN